MSSTTLRQHTLYLKMHYVCFSVKKEEALKQSLEAKNSQIYIQRSKVNCTILYGHRS